ncbi:hypothetical protein CTI12_AA452100 [Artemisia annua]|uniref:Uncharacterized protein n=1 Tax=Artemisia annua TaxID=35608 RepID=A0A2U1LUK0_ARTAN|nr:hypothetical protein CTI12_AA452100 [Artemisia annua]
MSLDSKRQGSSSSNSFWALATAMMCSRLRIDDKKCKHLAFDTLELNTSLLDHLPEVKILCYSAEMHNVDQD